MQYAGARRGARRYRRELVDCIRIPEIFKAFPHLNEEI